MKEINSYTSINLQNNLIIDKDELSKILKHFANILFIVWCVLFVFVMLPVEKNTNLKFRMINNKYTINALVNLNTNLIKPTSFGVTNFRIENQTKNDIIFNLKIYQVYNNQICQDFPMLYKVKSEILFDASEEWVNAENLAFHNISITTGCSELFYIAWLWESDINGEIDNYFGVKGGKFYLIVNLQEI